MHKLRSYGIGGTVLSWFKSWLSNRVQYVSFCGVKSEPLSIASGIPQGTPLSCPLFNVYINDVVKHVNFCHINLFADDTILWIDADTVGNALEQLASDFHNVKRYFDMCQMKLNVNKTKLMIMGQDDMNDVDLDGDTLECVHEIKYLGVIIDDKLLLKRNAEHVAIKMSRMVGFMNRNRKKLPATTRLTLYKCMIGSHVDYCSTVLFLNRKEEIRMLQKVQNRALRIITYGNRYSSIVQMLQQTQLLSVWQRICFNVLLMIYKTTKNLLPGYLSVNIERVGDVQPYGLRSNERLRPISVISHSEQDSVWYRGIRLFNQMSVQYNTKCDELEDFKEMAIRYVRDNVSVNM